MLSRFTKAFIAIIFALVRYSPFYTTDPRELTGDGQFLIVSLGVLHPQSKQYLDPWSGDQFGEGGVEQHLAIKPGEEVVKGKPIMQKLGNETAKCRTLMTLHSWADHWFSGRSWEGRLGSYCGFKSLPSACIALSYSPDRHTMTLRYPEVIQPTLHSRRKTS